MNATAAAPSTDAALPEMAELDRDDALASMDGDVELLEQVVAAFLEQAPVMLNELQDAVRTGSARRLERAAHPPALAR